MTPDKLLDAIGLLDDRHFSDDKKSAVIPWRRRALVFLAAVLVLMLSVVTAMAVSPELREQVFRFFHIEQEQTIPESTAATKFTPDDMFAEPNIVIGGVIQGKYIHTPVSTHARNGIYLVCTDEVEMRQGSHYDGYYEENGQFIKLEEHSFNHNYTLYGNEIHVEFNWVEHKDSVSMTWAAPNVPFRKDNESGSASSALFTFNIYWKGEDGKWIGTWYPVLLNLYTGELTDILAGTSVNRLQNIDKCAISPDQTKLLLGQDTEDGYSLYYADLETKSVYSVDELSGQKATACSLIDNTLACWNLTDDRYTAWKIDLTTLERSELFDSKQNAAATPEPDAGIVFLEGFDSLNRWGDMYIGSRFALEADESQNIYIIDLATGAKAIMEGFTWTPGMQQTPSPDGTKLLLAGSSGDTDFEYVGVLDYSRMTFAEFSRDNPQDEYLAYWFDKNTVVISSVVTFESKCSNYYQYSLIPETDTAPPVVQQSAPTTDSNGTSFFPAVPTTWSANCNEYIRLRAYPDGEVIAQIPRGETMQLKSWDGKYAKVSYKGMTGFVLTNYIMPKDRSFFDDCLDIVKPTGVYSYAQMLSDIEKLKAQHPMTVSSSSIGVTSMGRDIPVIRIGDQNAQHHILLQGAIHGREHLSAWVLMAIADYWLDHGMERYGNVCCHIIPMANPDGVIISQTGTLNDAQHEIYLQDLEKGYTSTDEHRYAEIWKANGEGIDLNRNFPAGWQWIDDRTAPSSQKYQGSAPFCAPETAALRDYTLQYAFDATVSYHASGSLIYYSYGDKASVNEQSKSLAQAVCDVSGYPLADSIGVDGAGYKDWAIDALQIPSITIEIGCAEAPLAEREVYSIFVRNFRILDAISQWLRTKQ